MKKLTMMTLTGLLLVALAAPVLAFGPVDVDAGVAMNSKYVWRGMVATPDPVLQPEVGLSLFGFSAGFWGNIDTNDVNDREFEFTETDWTLGYGMSLPMLNFGVGFIHYAFPNSEVSGTTELYVSASANVVLAPSLTIYQDIDEIKGAYWEASLGHDVAISPTTNLNLTTGLGLGSKGYIEGYFGPATLLPAVPEVPGNASVTDFYVTAAVPFDMALFFTFTPSVTYSTLLSDVKDIVGSTDGAVYHGETDAVIWGLSAMFRF